jgi:hypothetical protein
MELSDIVRVVLAGDLLAARQWVTDAKRSGLNWERLPEPAADGVELAVAAGLVELFAERDGTKPPDWTANVGAQAELMVIDPGLENMPRSFAHAKAHGPAPLRRRNLVAPPDFLDVA